MSNGSSVLFHNFKEIRSSAFCVSLSCLAGSFSPTSFSPESSLWNEIMKLGQPQRGAKRHRQFKGLPWPEVPELGRATFLSMPTSFDAIARRLKLLGKIGAGTSGKVYKAQDKTSGEKVAVKIAVDEMGEVEAKELLTLHKVQTHENIIKLRDGVCNPFWFAMVQDLGHTSLSEYVKNGIAGGGSISPSPGGSVPTNPAAKILYQVLCGLEHVHKCRVIHRDLHASNILLSREGTAMLCDFGMAVFEVGLVRRLREQALGGLRFNVFRAGARGVVCRWIYFPERRQVDGCPACGI